MSELKKYIPDITDEEISQDVDVSVVSAYGGMTCLVISASKVKDFVDGQERVLGLDYHLVIERE
jgi:hypothetical protein